MNWTSIAFDWNQVRAFLVTAEEGSFSAAARALRLSQPTLGRQVAALEQQLGVTLFERPGRKLLLTSSGLELLQHVRAMGEAAGRISLTASGQSQTIAGHVCITATDGISMYMLPDALKRLRKEAPGISIEIVASNAVHDLRRREADIAIRHGRPEQPDLIARFLRDIPMRLYATPEFLDQIGRPKATDDLSDVVFIGFEQTDRFTEWLNDIGLSLSAENFMLMSENGAVVWELVRKGLGIGIMAEEVARHFGGLECAFPELENVMVPMWLVTHRELRTSPRIRKVYDILAETLS